MSVEAPLQMHLQFDSLRSVFTAEWEGFDVPHWSSILRVVSRRSCYAWRWMHSSLGVRRAGWSQVCSRPQRHVACTMALSVTTEESEEVRGSCFALAVTISRCLLRNICSSIRLLKVT